MILSWSFDIVDSLWSTNVVTLLSELSFGTEQAA